MGRGPTEPIEQQDIEELCNLLKAILAELKRMNNYWTPPEPRQPLT